MTCAAGSTLDGLRLLLVDDDEVDREGMTRMLGKFGQPIELCVAGSLAEAGLVLRPQRFDCVLLDYHIQNDAGVELIPDVLTHRAELCPIILVTTRECESLIVEAMRHGVSDYVAKSNLNVDRLRVIVGGAIERANAEQSRREAQRTARERHVRRQHQPRVPRTPQRRHRSHPFVAAHGAHAGLVDRIRIAGKSLLLIASNVLDLSKLGAAALKLERVSFFTRRALSELIELARVSAESKEVALALDVADDVPAALTGDAARLQQVLGNLQTNAIKFTLAGEVRLARQQADKAVVRFEARDSGIGISPEALPQLFQPFAQADVSTTRCYGGAGLGLSIARELMPLMGGEIGAQSHVGGR